MLAYSSDANKGVLQDVTAGSGGYRMSVAGLLTALLSAEGETVKPRRLLLMADIGC